MFMLESMIDCVHAEMFQSTSTSNAWKYWMKYQVAIMIYA